MERTPAGAGLDKQLPRDLQDGKMPPPHLPDLGRLTFIYVTHDPQGGKLSNHCRTVIAVIECGGGFGAGSDGPHFEDLLYERPGRPLRRPPYFGRRLSNFLAGTVRGIEDDFCRGGAGVRRGGDHPSFVSRPARHGAEKVMLTTRPERIRFAGRRHSLLRSTRAAEKQKEEDRKEKKVPASRDEAVLFVVVCRPKETLPRYMLAGTRRHRDGCWKRAVECGRSARAVSAEADGEIAWSGSRIRFPCLRGVEIIGFENQFRRD